MDLALSGGFETKVVASVGRLFALGILFCDALHRALARAAVGAEAKP